MIVASESLARGIGLKALSSSFETPRSQRPVCRIPCLLCLLIPGITCSLRDSRDVDSDSLNRQDCILRHITETPIVFLMKYIGVMSKKYLQGLAIQSLLRSEGFDDVWRLPFPTHAQRRKYPFVELYWKIG